MKRIFIISALFIAAAGCGGNETSKEEKTTGSDSAVTAVETTPVETKMESADPVMDSASKMKAWMAFMSPGKEHEWMAKFNGTWKEEMKIWMEEGQPEEKHTSMCTNKMIYNGLYQQSVHKGNFNGMPFEGTSTMGYDNAKKKFVSTWIDNMGSGIMYTEGTYDSSNKMLTLAGTCTDPLSGKVMNVRETMSIIDDKTQMMEMYETKNGKERKTMEMKLTKM